MARPGRLGADPDVSHSSRCSEEVVARVWLCISKPDKNNHGGAR